MISAPPNFYDLLRGRVSPLEWTSDLFRSFQSLDEPVELAHQQSRLNLDEDDAWTDLEIGLDELGMNLVDFRQADKSKRGSRKGSRSWEQIDGDLFHQTASFVDDVERCVNIPAHVLITPTAVGIAHPPTAYLYGGHAGNRNFNHVEVACRACGVEGNPKTFWRTKKERKAKTPPEDLWREASDNQLAAAFLVAEYHARLNSLHGHDHHSYAYHRNTHRSRVSDPGSRIALNLGPRLRDELDQTPITKLGSGKLTPRAWGNPDGGDYSWRVK